MKKGIDISHNNREIYWNRVKGAGVEFVIIRAGYGYHNGCDKKLAENVAKCEELGLPYGFYWASYAADAEDAHLEAIECLDHIRPYTPVLPIYFDWEDFSYQYALKIKGDIDKKEANEFARVFCGIIKENGYKSGVYTNYNMYQDVWDKPLFTEYELWLAHWDVSEPLVHTPLWQYNVLNTNISPGPVDWDIAYLDITAPNKEDKNNCTCPCIRCSNYKEKGM